LKQQLASRRGVTREKRGHNSLDGKSLRGAPKSPNDVTSALCNTVHFLPKTSGSNARAKLASCLGHHLTSLRPWQHGSQSSPNPRTHHKAATIAFYRVCHILGKNNESFEDSDILKEAFLKAENNLFESFNSKT